VIVSSRRDLGHLNWYEGKRRVWLRRIQKLSTIVLANANPIRDVLIAAGDFAPGKVRVIHNGVDLARFRCSPERQKLFPQAGTGKLIVLVGNMHSEVKGHSCLIAAATGVIREFPLTRFVLIGDGAKRGKYEREVQALGLSENFIFLGRRNDIPELLACCDIAVLPSLAEGLPNATLEYMAAGLPCIISNAGGNIELVEDGVTGLLAPARDSVALSAAFLKLLREPLLARRIGLKGQEFVEHNFSFERLVRQVEDLYTELLQKPARIS